MAADQSHATAVPDWLREHYELVDAAALSDYSRDFADDIVIRFGAAEPVSGKVAVCEALQAGHDAHQMHHTFRNVWTFADTTIVEFYVRYTFADGSVEDVPVVSIIERLDHLITSLRVFIDRHPLLDREKAR